MNQGLSAVPGATATSRREEDRSPIVEDSDIDAQVRAASADPEEPPKRESSSGGPKAGSQDTAGVWRIDVGVVCASLDEIPGKAEISSDPPVDALAVGHYLGVRPQNAEEALDKAISSSGKLVGKVTKPGEPLKKADYLLTQFTERGVIRGELAELFLLPDPRTDGGSGGGPDVSSARVDRVIAIAGMGMPGRFGVPELVVLGRELSWALGRMGKRHLATVLIGAGVGNIPIPAAVGAWLHGLAATATGSHVDDRRLLRRVTFVEYDPANALAVDEAIRKAIDADDKRRERLKKERGRAPADEEHVEFRHAALGEDERKRLAEASMQGKAGGARLGSGEPVPTRVTIVREGRVYRFGAITKDASIPEREVRLDPELIEEVNRGLIVKADATKVGPDRNWSAAITEALERQLEEGLFLGQLLLPDDLRGHLASREPLVLLLDATTARVHWEATALPEPSGLRLNGRVVCNIEEQFLGLSRGLTRQLRSTFAPPPEPPPPPRRILRVLVIADPASQDKPLYNADKEADDLEGLFRAFDVVHGAKSPHRVEVVKLTGAQEATRTNVLRHLMVKGPFDVLHYAGHCVYKEQDPDASGWLFAKGQLITARELNRIDRIPKFVFSNACESGITPDRARERSESMAPNFAESFFARGVSNFVCTAWPVDDVAGRKFVRELYAALLGLAESGKGADGSGYLYGPADFQPIHEAMRRARVRIMEIPGGEFTWGAYQHYGNPFFRFFDPETMGR